MATQHSRSAARMMLAPAVVLLLGWMLVPLVMTLYFSFKRYLPLRGGDLGWTGFDVANTKCPDDRYVRVALGRDYAEAAPVRGLRRGDAREDLCVSVQVQQ